MTHVEIICACCAAETDDAVLCEGCDEQPVCDACRSEWIMLGGPILCPDCVPSDVCAGRATIVWPDDMEDWAQDRLRKMYQGRGGDRPVNHRRAPETDPVEAAPCPDPADGIVIGCLLGLLVFDVVFALAHLML